MTLAIISRNYLRNGQSFLLPLSLVELKLDPGNNRTTGVFWPDMRKRSMASSNVAGWLMTIETHIKERAMLWALSGSLKEDGLCAADREMEAGSVTERKFEWFCISLLCQRRFFSQNLPSQREQENSDGSEYSSANILYHTSWFCCLKLQQ